MSKVIPDAETVLFWAKQDSDINMAAHLERSEYELCIPEKVHEWLPEEEYEGIFEAARILPCTDIEFAKAKRRHLRLGGPQVAAIGIANEQISQGKTCYCLSDTDLAQDAFNRADIPHWDSISLTATLVDDRILKFEEGERWVEALIEAGANAPPNYTSLIKSKAATFPV